MKEQFSTWALVELFGHTRIAGEVTEQTIAGGAMIRIDVPETETSPAFTRIVNVNAIYAINPMTEELARSLAGQLRIKPVQPWDIRDFIERNNKALTEPLGSVDDSFLYEDLP